MGLAPLMMHWIVSICSEEAMFEIWLKSIEVKGIKTLSKIDDRARVVAGVDEDYRSS